VEGEYADLSVEERLNALVALVTTVNQGNAIRVALEVQIDHLGVLFHRDENIGAVVNLEGG
jgi:hypothetical protein